MYMCMYMHMLPHVTCCMCMYMYVRGALQKKMIAHEAAGARDARRCDARVCVRGRLAVRLQSPVSYKVRSRK